MTLKCVVCTASIEWSGVKWSLTRGSKQRKDIKPWRQKVVAVAYKRCSFSRGSKNRALTEKILVVWIQGRLDEDIAYKR